MELPGRLEPLHLLKLRGQFQLDAFPFGVSGLVDDEIAANRVQPVSKVSFRLILETWEMFQRSDQRLLHQVLRVSPAASPRRQPPPPRTLQIWPQPGEQHGKSRERHLDLREEAR